MSGPRLARQVVSTFGKVADWLAAVMVGMTVAVAILSLPAGLLQCVTGRAAGATS